MKPAPLVLAVAVAAACSSGSPTPVTPAVAPVTVVDAAPPSPTGPATIDGVAIPDSPEADPLRWVLGLLAPGHAPLDEAAAAARFDPGFLAKVPAAQLAKTLDSLAGQLAPVTLTSVEAGPGGKGLIAHLGSKGGPVRVLIVVDPATTKIAGLLIQPDLAAAPALKSFDELAAALPALAEHSQFLVAELKKGACTSLHEAHAGDELAIGSAFKLYVLLAVVDRIVAGKLGWDTEVAIRDDWKSLPSGTMQDEAGGTKHPLRTFAEQMISISDNTATDHLLYTVGRKRVEAAVTAGGHARPAIDVPFMSTRELFLLKLTGSAADAEKFIGMTPLRKRAYLDDQLAGKRPALDGADAWKTPRWIGNLEWFASSTDICHVMATLAGRAAKPAAAPLLDVLAINPGLPVDKAAFPYVGFKGGSEPGVMSLNWLLRRRDDRWFVVTFTFNDSTAELDETKLLATVGSAFALLAAEP